MLARSRCCLLLLHVVMILNVSQDFVEPFKSSQHGGKKVLRIFANIRELNEIHSQILCALPSDTDTMVVLKCITVFTMAVSENMQERRS